MRTKVILTKKTLDGQFILTYGADRTIISFEMNGNLTDEQRQYFSRNLPATMDALELFVDKHKLVAVIEQ